MSISLVLHPADDASFIIDAHFNLYEHQSTYNPNMPMRSLIYFSDYVKDFIKKREIYGKQLVKIPTPRFAVFYNGLEKRPEIETLLLSDAYEQPVENPELELICTVYNINVGYNRELLKQCPVLKKYMVFIDRVRYNVRRLQKASMNNPYLLANDKQILEQAINEAINYCITHHILEDFFREHRWEVEKAMTLDYTYERRMELNREEGFSEGLDQGISQGVQESILNLMQTMKWSMEQAMDALCIPEDERSRYHS